MWLTKWLVFLDLEFMVDTGSYIVSKTHFKPTMSNSYRHARSNHLGKFRRLRCTRIKDYNEQGAVLRKRFLEKGYDNDHIHMV